MNSHNSGWTERVTMSRWSWRSFCHSARAIAAVPAASRRSAEAARSTTLGADIAEPPLFRDRVAGHAGEDLLEVRGGVAAAQLLRRPVFDDAAVVHDRQPVAVALGLLHHVRGHEHRGAGLTAQHVDAVPDHA